MKQIFTLIALFASYYSFSQNAEIRGKITDAYTKEPLVGASVRYDKGRGVISDANGFFKITLAAGQYDVIFTSIGYKRQKQAITLSAGEKKEVNIQLATEAFEFSEISTVSQYKKNAAKENVSTDVVTAEEIKHTNSQDLGEALGRTSGVLVQDGQITIRGGSGYSYGVGSRTAVMQDGQSLMSADLGQGQNSMAELENANQVEVVKGASSVIYGSSALNGVVNVVTSWPVEDTPRTNIDISTGVYGNTPKVYQHWWDNAQPFFYDINVNHRRKEGNLSIVAGGNITGKNSYLQDDNDWRVQGFFKTRYISPKIEGLNFGVDGSLQYETIDEFFISKDLDSSAYREGAGSSSDYLRLNIDPHLTYATARGHVYNLKIRYMNIDRFGGDGPAAPTAVSHQVMTEDQYQYKWKHMIVFTAGAPFTIGDSRSNLYNDIHINLFAALYSQLEFNYKGLSVQAGLRYEIQKVDNDLEKGIPVFRSGLNYEITKSTHVFASWGQAYRIPSIGERDILQNFYSGILVVPNDTLHAEHGWSSEIGINQNFKIGQHFIGIVSLSVFYQRYSEFTEYDFGTYANRFPGSGQIITTDTSLLNNVGLGKSSVNTPLNQQSLFGIQAHNIENAQIFGYEFEVKGRGQIGPIGITVGAGYSYNYGSTLPAGDTSHYTLGKFFRDAFIYNVHRVQDPNSQAYQHLLEYRARHLIRSDIELKYWKIYAGATLSYTSQPELIPATITLAIDYISGNNSFSNYLEAHKWGDVWADVRAGYIYNRHIEFGFIIKNVANRFYELRPGKPEPIRNFTLQFRYKF